jgi:aldehyde:ferredoxin oxidoreductase
LKKFLGGRGLASYFLYKRVPQRIDPLSPENLLIFAAGPLAGTGWPTGSRITVAAKSPLTSGLGYAHAGGDFGPELRFAGYDMLLISGKATTPVYIYLENTNQEIRDASSMWKQLTSVAIETIQKEEGKCRVACIGPAGENLVRVSSIITERKGTAARCGLGAVMGSKNLKAVAVKGTKKIDFADHQRFRALCEEGLARYSPRNPSLQRLSNEGTLLLIKPKNEIGDLPAKNHQIARVPWADMISGETIRRKYHDRSESCFACPIHCRAYSKVYEGKHAPIKGVRPEYESTDALGPMCWISDFSAIMKMNELCNDLGLDTISTGTIVAFAMELHEKGLIKESDTKLPLAWGDDESALKIIQMMAYREGFGAILAEGVARAAEKIGGEAKRYAMHVKGMELPCQEPRTLKAFALGHAVSNRGADHLYALPTIDSAGRWDIAEQLFPNTPLDDLMDTRCPSYKAEMVVFTEHYCAISDALGVCKFSTADTYTFMPSEFANCLSILTGEKFSEKDLLTCGERIINLERCFNVREGFSKKDDTLPERFLSEPYNGGVVELEEMLSKYYTLRGWSRHGIPLRKTLTNLGLDEI